MASKVSAYWVSDPLLGASHPPPRHPANIPCVGQSLTGEQTGAQRDHWHAQDLRKQVTEFEILGDNNCDYGCHLLGTYYVSVPFTLYYFIETITLWDGYVLSFALEVSEKWNDLPKAIQARKSWHQNSINQSFIHLINMYCLLCARCWRYRNELSRALALMELTFHWGRYSKPNTYKICQVAVNHKEKENRVRG